MTISTVTRGAILDLVFLAAAWADYAQNDGSSPETQIAVGLHTADPGISGTMATNETSYTSYARQNKARSSADWSRIANSISPNADIQFPIGTGGGGTITHFSTGKSGGGAAPLLWYGTLTPSFTAGAGKRPILLAATTISLT
jgi:hypothetical protein